MQIHHGQDRGKALILNLVSGDPGRGAQSEMERETCDNCMICIA